MIHQLIFAAPRPGMTDDEFQRYWVENHAVNFASKIPQIKRYLIDTTIPFEQASDLPFRGIAEIWLENEKEQLASLQTKEFLEGARLDEPNWAAFWLTLVLDTDAYVILEGPPLTKDPTWVKMVVLNKRKQGMSLEDFRGYSREIHAPLLMQLPGLQRCLLCFSRDALYVMGESRFDSVWQLWFEDVPALEQALASRAYLERVKPDREEFIESKYIFTMVTKEHWIIGPESR